MIHHQLINRRRKFSRCGKFPPLAFFLVLYATELTNGLLHHTRSNRRSRWISSGILGDGGRDNDNVDTTVAVASVQIFDHVYTPKVCKELHDLAVDHADRGMDGASIFYRNQACLTPLETALSSFLDAVGDNNGHQQHNVVEYWSREEYLNLDVHSDMDEEEFQDNSVLRYPSFGHVLYLQKAPKLRAPTVVFPTKLGGWKEETTSTVPLITVPVVPGRVLRFPGNAMHAVPKPAFRWLLSEREQQMFDRQETFDEDTARDDDSEDDVDNFDERSVILFNTWNDNGPKGISQDYSTGILPDGIELDDVENDLYLQQQQQIRHIEWASIYGESFKGLWCSPRDAWRHVRVSSGQNEGNKSDASAKNVCVSLLGNQRRRQYPSTHVNLLSFEGFEEAFVDPHQPMIIHLMVNERH